MVRYLIGARRGHGKHRVPGVGRDVGGQNLGVGQGDWAAPQRHQNAAALGVGGKVGGGGKVGTCGSSGTGRPRGTGGAGWTLHGGGCQSALHLCFQKELVLRRGFQHTADALIGGQHVADCGGRAAETGQGSQNILQFLSFSVENMAQAEFFHRNRRENLINCVFPFNGGIHYGKARQRHYRESPFKLRGTY